MLLSRAMRRVGAGSALFALWLQLALSFGHNHPEDFAGLAMPSAAGFVAAVFAEHALPGSPANPSADGFAHDACAICAAMALADCLVLPDDPVPVPGRLLAAHHTLPRPDGFLFVASAYRLFETRAPPVVV